MIGQRVGFDAAPERALHQIDRREHPVRVGRMTVQINIQHGVCNSKIIQLKQIVTIRSDDNRKPWRARATVILANARIECVSDLKDVM
jgi:hypothetical protein